MKTTKTVLLGIALGTAPLLVAGLFLSSPPPPPRPDPGPEIAALQAQVASLTSRLRATDQRISAAESYLAGGAESALEELGLREAGAAPEPDEPIVAAPALSLGAAREEVEDALGPPDDVVLGDHGLELRYYRRGVRATLDGLARLSELRLYGVRGHDYVPARWELHDVTVGMTGAEVMRRLGQPDAGLLTEDGGYELSYPEHDLVIQLGPAPRHLVEVFRIGGEGVVSGRPGSGR